MCQHEDVLEKFYLYQTKTRYYLVGHTKDQEVWRILKFSRLEPQQLEISEDPTRYSKKECAALIKQIHDGNVQHGGLQLVCEAYGVIGCFRFLEGYYLLVVSKRRYQGSICGHKVYGIAEKGLVQLTHPGSQPSFDFLSKNSRESASERRYRKLLLTGLDLTKDFYFSYTYCLSHTLQSNFTAESKGCSFNSMFVWNEYLTRPLRERLGNCQWVVGLIHGFWQQRTLSLFGRMLTLTLIGRRSKYFAGTRYRKRGVSDQGYVANEVETEQLVFVDNCRTTSHMGMAAVVQVRGSIPLYWKQEGHKLKPDIIVQHYDPLYKATQLHFADLASRYGSPTVVLNLLKQVEKRPRESVLRTEFRTAVNYINAKTPPAENKIHYHQYDMNYGAKRKGTDVLLEMSNILNAACKAIGHFHFSSGRGKVSVPSFETQCGVLRTNCIDCLDRTNVAQFAYGLNALGYQLQSLGITDTPSLDRNSSVARQLMDMYEAMGHTLAMQYGGSEAHSKFFQRQRGDWEAATQSRDLMTSIRRFYSNTYTDAEKQDAINLFLGNFVPVAGQPQLWELESDYYLHTGRGSHHSKSPSVDSGRKSFFDIQTSCSVLNFGSALGFTSGFSSPLERTTSSGSSTMSVMTSSDIDTISEKDSASSHLPSIASLVSRGTLPTGPSSAELNLNSCDHPIPLLDATNRSGDLDIPLSMATATSTPLKATQTFRDAVSHPSLTSLTATPAPPSGMIHPSASTPALPSASRSGVLQRAPSARQTVSSLQPSRGVLGQQGDVKFATTTPPSQSRSQIDDGISTGSEISNFVSPFETTASHGVVRDRETASLSTEGTGSAQASNDGLSDVSAGGGAAPHEPKAAALMNTFAMRRHSRHGDGASKRLRLWSFDKVLSKEPFGVQPATLYNSPTVQKSAIPLWLASPLGIRRGTDSLASLRDSTEDKNDVVCASSSALSPPTRPLRRTRSDSKLSELTTGSKLILQEGFPPPSIKADSGVASGGRAGDNSVKRSGIASPPMHYKAFAALPDDPGRAITVTAQSVATAPRQKMFPFIMFRQQSRTIAAMNIEPPAKKNAVAFSRRGLRTDDTRHKAQPLEIGDMLYGADAVVRGEDSLGVPAMVLDWWVNKEGPSEAWWRQEGKVRAAYTRFLDKTLSLDSMADGTLHSTYSGLCTPGVVLSMDGFKGGAAGKWRRNAGLLSTITVAESELRRIAESELRNLVLSNEA